MNTQIRKDTNSITSPENKLPIRKKGVLIPYDNSFEAVSCFVNHVPSPEYEELQWALLDLAHECDRLKTFEDELRMMPDRLGADGGSVCGWGAKTPTAKEWADATYQAAKSLEERATEVAKLSKQQHTIYEANNGDD